ncbi:MAG: TonB-dependent receptor plug domain-containing protein, partial [Bacteroidales bacterium]|nr:TonB-dependent receptor plug domain-containing protein [Candidatus Cacconaster merdequi]
MSPDTLSAAVVSATMVQGENVPQQRFAGEQLQSLSTVSVADALKYFAGVQIKDYGGLGGQKTVNVRSLGTQHTGV